MRGGGMRFLPRCMRIGCAVYAICGGGAHATGCALSKECVLALRCATHQELPSLICSPSFVISPLRGCSLGTCVAFARG